MDGKNMETIFCLKGKRCPITPDSIGLETNDAWEDVYRCFLCCIIR